MSSSFPASAELLNVMAASAPAPLSVSALYAGITALPAPLAAAIRAQPNLVEVTEPLARQACSAVIKNGSCCTRQRAWPPRR